MRQLGACYDLSRARANRWHILTNAPSTEAIESALQLKLAHAQGTAKIVELELQGQKGAGVSSQVTHEPTVQVAIPLGFRV